MLMLLLLAVLCWQQVQTDPVRSAEQALHSMQEKSSTLHRQGEAAKGAQLRNFERRFNDLIQALADFAQEYNHGSGHTWPKKRAETLRRAMRALQQAEPSLREQRLGRPEKQ